MKDKINKTDRNNFKKIKYYGENFSFDKRSLKSLLRLKNLGLISIKCKVKNTGEIIPLHNYKYINCYLIAKLAF